MRRAPRGRGGAGPRWPVAARAQEPPAHDYYAWVASEAVDKLQLVRFGPAGLTIERTHTVGILPTDPDGPHGVALAPDGNHLFVSTGHGTPFGSLWKYSTRDDRLEGRVELGLFPATLQVSPDGYLAYVVNFNLHGDMVPSSVSVVATDEMLEVARIPTCVMPHGSRLNAQGTQALLGLHDGRRAGRDRYPDAWPCPGRSCSGRARSTGWTADDGVGERPGRGGARRRRPRDGAAQARQRVVLADLGAADARRPARLRGVQQGERDRGDRRRGLDPHPPDFRRATASTTWPSRTTGGCWWPPTSAASRCRCSTRRRARSSSGCRRDGRWSTAWRSRADDRYAFISVEGIGSEPGTVEVIDLRALATVATVDVGPMAGGIDVLPAARRTPPARQPPLGGLPRVPGAPPERQPHRRAEREDDDREAQPGWARAASALSAIFPPTNTRISATPGFR